MLVGPKIYRKRPRQNLLKHCERENVVGKTPERIVRSHVGDHLQFRASNHELQRARAWNILVVFHEIFGAEQLNDRPS